MRYYLDAPSGGPDWGRLFNVALFFKPSGPGRSSERKALRESRHLFALQHLRVWARNRRSPRAGSKTAIRQKLWFVLSAEELTTQPEIVSHNTGIQRCSQFVIVLSNIQWLRNLALVMSLSVNRKSDNVDHFSAYFKAMFRKLNARRNNVRALYSTNLENVS